MMRRHGLATGARWAEALEGGPFYVVAPKPVGAPQVGGFSGLANSPEGVTLRFTVGDEPTVIEIETRRKQRFNGRDWTMVAMLLARERRFQYPIVIEEARPRVTIGGRKRIFAGCSLGKNFTGRADVGEVTVLIRCPLAVAPKVELQRLEGKPLDDLMRVERERWSDLRRPSTRPPKRGGPS